MGVLRLHGFPLLIDVKRLSTRTSTEMCDELERMVAFFEELQTEGLPIGEFPSIRRLHSDKAGEFTVPFFAHFLTNHKTIDHTFTSGYDLLANCTAERSVGLIESSCLCSVYLFTRCWLLVLCGEICCSIFSLPFPTLHNCRRSLFIACCCPLHVALTRGRLLECVYKTYGQS